MILTGNPYQEFDSSKISNTWSKDLTFTDFHPSYDSDASTEPEIVDKKKTEMCRNWETKGFCSWGVKCSYAHGYDEL